MIIGIGVDIVEVQRIRAALENPQTGERFRDRVYTPGEIAYCARRRTGMESYAARFAAKEAVVKVLGKLVEWQEIEVVRTDGPPAICLHGRAATRAAELGVQHIHLSLSHTAEHAIAYVVATA